jgi:hypothetical protein
MKPPSTCCASQESIVFARGQVIPIIQALYAGDTETCNAAQQKAALVGARLTADAFYTLICLGRSRIDPDEAAALQTVDLSAFAPLEAPDLYPPQSAFFSKPHWTATVGYVSKGRTPSVRLRVCRRRDAVKTSSEHRTGTRSSLSFRYRGVYANFTPRRPARELGRRPPSCFTVSQRQTSAASAVAGVNAARARTFRSRV